MCVSLFTNLFTLFHSPVGIFPPTTPHSYPPIYSFSTSSGFISSDLSSLLPTYLLFFILQWVYFLLPLLILTHLFTLFHSLVGIFPPTTPHSYPPITTFSTSSGYISSCPSSFLPTYQLFFVFQSVLSKIFPPTSPHSYPPIYSFSTSSGFISSDLSSFLPTYHIFLTLQSVLSKIFSPTSPHSYPPIHSFSPSSGYISSDLSSFLPTYYNFFVFQWVYFLLPLLILTHLFTLSRLLVGLLQQT